MVAQPCSSGRSSEAPLRREPPVPLKNGYWETWRYNVSCCDLWPESKGPSSYKTLRGLFYVVNGMRKVKCDYRCRIQDTLINGSSSISDTFLVL